MITVDHFLAMGGFAPYVWPAFGVALIVLGGLVIESLVVYKKRQRELAAAERRRR